MVVQVHASELAQKEVEDEQTESDGVGDEQKEGARERRRKETKKQGGSPAMAQPDWEGTI